MVEVTGNRGVGWQRVVAELVAPIGDDQAFLDRLLRIMGRVSAARQGVVYVPPAGDGAQAEVRAIGIWPAAGVSVTGGSSSGGGGAGGAGGAVEETALGDGVAREGQGVEIECGPEARRAAWAALESGQTRSFSLESPSEMYDAAPSRGVILAVPIGQSAVDASKPAAVVTLLLEPRNRQALQSTAAMAEVLAGYVFGHAARQELRRSAAGGRALDLATRLIGAINSARRFKGAAMQLCNDLAKEFNCERVGLGWVRGDVVRLRALSDTEHFDRRMAVIQKLEAAMDECLDQEQPVVHPAPGPEVDAVLSQAITSSHRELTAHQAGRRAVSVPLRDGDDVVGVVTLESRPDQPGLDVSAVELLQSAMDLAAPVMKVRRNDDRWLAHRAWLSALEGAKWAVGARHTAWKLLIVAVAVVAAFVTFYTTMYRVNAQAFLQPVTRQIISAPFDGTIRATPGDVEAGSMVQAGQVLVELDTTEYELAAARARQEYVQAMAQLSAARAEGKSGEAARFAAQAESHLADEKLAQARKAQAVIRAPIAGTVIQGRLRERRDSSIKIGERLFEIAPLDSMQVVVRVDERDVSMIKPGGTGHVATRAFPDDRLAFTVDRVVPLATAEEGKNVFEVRGTLTETREWMRPGMEGLAKLDTQERSLLYIGTRRVIDAVRLWLW